MKNKRYKLEIRRYPDKTVLEIFYDSEEYGWISYFDNSLNTFKTTIRKNTLIPRFKGYDERVNNKILEYEQFIYSVIEAEDKVENYKNSKKIENRFYP